MLIREESLAWLFSEAVVTQVTAYPTRYKKQDFSSANNEYLWYVKLEENQEVRKETMAPSL